MSVDLSTTYLGFDLKNPMVASASPMTARLDSLRELEEAGVGAVVLPSIFEEQIEHEAMEMQRLMEQGADTFAEALSGYFPEFDDYADLFAEQGDFDDQSITGRDQHALMAASSSAVVWANSS